MRRLCGLLVAALAVTAAPAADPAPNLDQTAVDVLKDVHNRGAELYNRGDAPGCYRLYQGALTTVRAFLAHRPAVQKVIDDGLNEVARLGDPKAQAFRLHEVIEQVRGALKGEPKKPATAPQPPKADPKPKAAPAPANKPPAEGGTLTGTVTLDGQPLDKVTVTLVSLTLKEPRVFTAEVKEGMYTVEKPVPAGQYAVIVTGPKVPAKFQDLGAPGGIRIDVQPAPGKLSIDLKSK